MPLTDDAALPRPHRRHGLREREALGVLCALALAVLVFALWPGIDLIVSGWFYEGAGLFAGQHHGIVLASYVVVPWLGRGAFLLSLIVLLLWPLWRRVLGPAHRRIALALALSLLLGVAGLVNGVFKEHWGRARPIAVEAFGGSLPFRHPLVPRYDCATNCSFVSGHAATGFALAAVGLMAGPRRRRRWLVAGLVAGTLVGMGRVQQGGHYLSDVVFAGLVMMLAHVVLRDLWLRTVAWRRRRRRRRHPAAGTLPA